MAGHKFLGRLARGARTTDEKVFVTRVILHLSSAFEALKCKLLDRQNGDVARFFSLPIPSAVWEETKFAQNADFIEFVEECLRETLGHN